MSRMDEDYGLVFFPSLNENVGEMFNRKSTLFQTENQNDFYDNQNRYDALENNSTQVLSCKFFIAVASWTGLGLSFVIASSPR